MGGNGRSRLRRPGARRKRLQGVNERVRARITGERFLQPGHVEDAVEAIQQRAPLRGEPDQGAAPVGRIIDALDGAPGLFSANWAGPGKDFAPAIGRVQMELAKRGASTPEKRKAHFVSALVIAWPDGHQELFEGRVFGAVVDAPRGTSGFGYDPILQVAGRSETAAELDPAEKNAISHRGNAFRSMELIMRERLAN